MKKHVFRFGLLLAVALVFSSCVFLPRNLKMDIDESLSKEEEATVTFTRTRTGWFVMNEWGELDIQKNLYGRRSASSRDKITFTVPAGPNKFRFHLRFTFSNQYSSTTYRIDDLELQYNFVAGEKYQVKGSYKLHGFLGFGGTDFFLQLYNVTGKSQLLEERMVGTTRKIETNNEE